jgi:hypothetical protein
MMTLLEKPTDFTGCKAVTPARGGLTAPRNGRKKGRKNALVALAIVVLVGFTGSLHAQLAAPSVPAPAPVVETPSEAPARAAKEQPYEDQIISGSGTDSAISQLAGETPVDMQGYRADNAELRLYRADSTRGYQEMFVGLWAQHRWETLNWGDWLIEASGVAEQSNSVFSRQFVGGRGRLAQMNMAITPTLTLSNAVGFLRSYAPSVAEHANASVATRFSLPGPGFLGASHFWRREVETLSLAATSADNRSENGAWRLGVEGGSLTQSNGSSGYAVQRRDGQLLAAHGSYQWSPSTVTAGSLLRLADSRQWSQYSALHIDQLATMASIETVVRVQAIVQQGRAAENALDVQASGSRKGVWFDAERRASVRTTRVAGWIFDPQLYWYDNLLSAGQKGLSWREEIADSGLQWAVGSEVNQYDPTITGRAGQRSVSFNGSMNYRIDRSKSWNAAGQILDAKSTFDDGFSSARRYVNLDFAYGLAQKRLADQFKLVYAQSQVNAPERTSNSRLIELLWGRTYQEFRDLEFDFSVGLGYDQNDGASRLRPHLRVSRRWGKDGLLDGSVTFNHARDSSSYSTSYVTGFNATLNAKLTPELNLQLTAAITQSQQNKSQPTPQFANSGLNDPAAKRSQDRSIWLSLRYAWAGGTPLVGNLPGSGAGVGTIGGVAFFDDNGDGIRQPDEKLAGKVSLTLDGIMTVVTDADGSYLFPVVRSGKHSIRIDAASVRLPYGVNDEVIRNIIVTPRTQTEVLIALPKLGD